jgi:ribosome-associated protein
MRKNKEINEEELEEGPSKSEVKRQMHARQALGKTLTELNDKQLSLMPIENEKLLAAMRETRRISSKNALRRHMQFIGRLMREVDPEPIEAALESMRRPTREANEAFHRLEQLRDEILAAGMPGVERVLNLWPEADRQHVRQLVLQHQREQQKNKPPAASRKLFRYLRELLENYGAGSSRS